MQADEINSKTEQYLANWCDEMNSAELYRLMAKREKNEKLSGIYQRLAAVEEGHAETWRARLRR